MAIDLGVLQRRLLDGLSQRAARFWDEPVAVSLRLIAVIFATLAVVGLLLDAAGVSGRLSVGPIDALFLLVLAWILSSKKVSQILIGIFLFIAFAVSIILLILPVEALVSSVTKTIEDDLKVQRSMLLAAQDVSWAQANLQNLASSNPEVAKQFAFGAAQDALTKAHEKLPKNDQDLSGKLVQQVTQTVSTLLNKAAPFVFTMLMGLMGSAIAVSRQFVSNFDEKPPIWYLYRLLQGMIIALLIVYGLVAGMLSLGVNTGNEPIDIAKFDTNKYFIGFVSALAGLFSEHAFAKLESVSANVFGKKRPEGEQAVQAGAATQPGASSRRTSARRDEQG